ncbi:3-deoxy-D-manno-octulosonate 8-phosphate phosphatase, YrbI family [Desulfonatronospira thiodismutans ASO3-1]|uniref:3-deoxy-D-manno-octulosonate 8-phosphate phosphatase, YrbI family n=1 Tax=Desulfonatronospira thiodismutans ASO3-1 TaxID=555779 RepID=D6SSE9_9BACT|nr:MULTISPECIES: 3-deoxy-D-manno-octulosonate 8-phosphate phosphatase YrbI family [Desulfonatronospira]EFI33615.1 3-deoxy-D-manno-octulosonate 8-phosphate phosphatase, YrbI family [Desulfonatronospira thiodismutans ASO3-1]RQD73669.1 MAG: phenylphosphate carboxylase subunit delta [Desulfonatronospira sp. MSAO_Bac3]
MHNHPAQAAQKVKLLVLDADGVLTDGGLYYDPDGRIIKRFNVQDGLGLKLAMAAGLEVAVITGLNSGAVETRVKELGINDYFSGSTHKMPFIRQLSREKNLLFSQMAYLGDDWVDAGPMQCVGLPMAVANAQPEIRKLAAWTSTQRGGHGAVRQAVRFILQAQGRLEQEWRKWVQKHA